MSSQEDTHSDFLKKGTIIQSGLTDRIKVILTYCKYRKTPQNAHRPAVIARLVVKHGRFTKSHTKSKYKNWLTLTDLIALNRCIEKATRIIEDYNNGLIDLDDDIQGSLSEVDELHALDILLEKAIQDLALPQNKSQYNK